MNDLDRLKRVSKLIGIKNIEKKAKNIKNYKKTGKSSVPSSKKTSTPKSGDVPLSKKTYDLTTEQGRSDIKKDNKQKWKPIKSEFTPSEYFQYTESEMHKSQLQLQQLKQQREQIDINKTYIQSKDGRQVYISGIELRNKYDKAIRQGKTNLDISFKAYSLAKEGTEKWSPDTRIKRTSESYQINFPYAGAEDYRYYNKITKNPLVGLATSFTGEDPLGLKSSYYRATGQHEKVTETKIKAMQEARKPFHEFYLGSPMGVIGITALTAGGATIGLGALSQIVPRTAQVIGYGGTILYGTSIGAQAIPSVYKSYKTGDWGSTIGLSTMTGLSLASAYGGAKAGFSIIKPKMHITQFKIKGRDIFKAENYLFNIGKKPVLKYGKTKIVMDKATAEWFRSAYAPKGKTWSGVPENKLLPQFTKTRTDYLSYKPYQGLTYTTKWNNKLFIETGAGWQPKPQTIVNPYALSNKILPKPKLYRSYEIFYRVISYKPIIGFKPIKINIKPFKKSFKVADIIKTDKQLFKDLKTGEVSVSKQGTISILKPKLITKAEKIVIPKQLLKPVYKRISLQQSIQKSAMKTQQFYKFKKELASDTKLKQVFATMQSSLFRTAQTQAMKLDFTQAQVSRLDYKKSFASMSELQTASAQALRIDTAQAQITGTASLQALGQKMRFDLIKIPMYDFKTELINPPITAFIPELGGVGRKQKAKPEQGFDVLVKDRYIYKGKKTPQKFIKINKKPLNYNDAMSYGATVVDNSASRSFKIKPTKGKTSKPDIALTNFNLISNQFYKKKKTYIERTMFAINTGGEIRDISARGWVAERRKLYPKPKKQKITKTKIIKMKPLLNNKEIDKLMRSVGF